MALSPLDILVAKAWAGDAKAQEEIAPLPIWVSFTPQVEELPAEAEYGWQLLNAEIGYLCTDWSNLEGNLDILFSSILRVDMASAKVILGTLTSNKIKRDVITNVSRLVIYSEKHIRAVERIMRRTAKAASKRNFLIHGAATISSKFPRRLTVHAISADLDPALMHYEAWGLGDLQDLRKTVNSITKDLEILSRVIVRARRRPSNEKRSQAPDATWEIGNSRRQAPPAKKPAPQPSSPQSQRKPKKLSSAQKRAQRGGG